MCAQFLIRASNKILRERFGIIIPEEYNDEGWTIRVLPYGKSPVVINEQGSAKIKQMQFSLVPSWSKEKKPKFATHNARLENQDPSGRTQWIYEKPTWKEPFLKTHCLVPITDFIEPIYKGELAGNMVKFTPKKQDVLAAAGIWSEWIGKDGEVIESFSILTDHPIPFVQEIGHDRSPVFLSVDAAKEWLSGQTRKPQEWVEFLRANTDKSELEVSVDRPLKPGWEKRI